MIVETLIACAILYPFLQPLYSYFKDDYKLRQFPSPSFAGFSSLWRIWYNIQKKHYLAIHQAHKDLGTHVRMAPKHISISDPSAMSEIYGHGANFLKDGWYDGGAGAHRNMGDTRDKAEHQSKRKKFAHVFAQKTILGLEHNVKEMVQVLNNEVDKHVVSGETINMRRYLNYFTIDLISKLLYGETLGCMSRGNDVVTAETKDGKIYQTTLIDALHLSMSINTSLGMEPGLLPITRKLFANHPYRKAGGRFEDIVYHHTMKRLRSEEAGDDFFSKLLVNSKGEELNLEMGEILAESGVILNAGSDTTTSALTSTLFLIFKHPHVLKRLRKELDTVILEAGAIPTYDSLSKLPYLRACIEESLRLRPASSLGLPRIVPAGGRMIAGRFIEEGVTVSVPTYTLLRDKVFDEPDRYKPERWLGADKDKLTTAHLPFSIGPRACIGRNIAYFEQYIVLASLIHKYDFELPSDDFELENIERFNSNPGELPMKVQIRRQ